MNQNQDGTPATQTSKPGEKAMTSQEKKSYNKMHYEKNRAEILERAKTKYHSKNLRFLNVIPLFKSKNKNDDQTPPTKKSKQSHTHLNSGTLFLTLLALSNTYFLVTETAQFYTLMDGSQVSGLLKALILEGAVIAFSTVLKGRTLITSLFHKLMIFLIYTYTVFALSGSVIHNAYSQKSQVTLFEKIVSELETELSKKIQLRDSYYQDNRVTRASQIEKALHELKQKLEHHRELLSKSPTKVMIWNTLLTLILFRILVMISNLYCFQELSRRYRTQLRAT